MALLQRPWGGQIKVPLFQYDRAAEVKDLREDKA
jgi:hypothetical protein